MMLMQLARVVVGYVLTLTRATGRCEREENSSANDAARDEREGFGPSRRTCLMQERLCTTCCRRAFLFGACPSCMHASGGSNRLV